MYLCSVKFVLVIEESNDNVSSAAVIYECRIAFYRLGNGRTGPWFSYMFILLVMNSAIVSERYSTCAS